MTQPLSQEDLEKRLKLVREARFLVQIVDEMNAQTMPPWKGEPTVRDIVRNMTVLLGGESNTVALSDRTQVFRQYRTAHPCRHSVRCWSEETAKEVFK